MSITYTIVPCRLGYLLVGATEKGIRAIGLGDSEADLVADLTHEFPTVTIKQAHDAFGSWITALLRYLDGDPRHLELPLHIEGAAFQRNVWSALNAIPYGSTRSYRDVGRSIGQPAAAREVAQACAENRIALVIPCHRVIHASGDFGGYRWGSERKRALLVQEASVADVAGYGGLGLRLVG